ncbi:hypothetical protein XCR1_1380008 [Xenorhabdus cabanillasii JM26]|uniref:Uncharacterized protein n=1 Tax=Xenorhabdus cabanillasii JM26 TaxID=1427517 RepID=W1IR59_9GAMM|nr:hypothetical protein XCR1_1380008 [Xenorhabdus cabanillasii JM26]
MTATQKGKTLLLPFWGAKEKALPKEGLLCGQGQALLSSLQLCVVAVM